MGLRNSTWYAVCALERIQVKDFNLRHYGQPISSFRESRLSGPIWFMRGITSG